MKLFENFLRETRQKRFWRQLRHFFVFLPYGRILKETGRLGACSLIMWVSLHLFRTPEHYDAVLVQKFVMISGLFCILIYPLYLSPNTYPSLLYGLPRILLFCLPLAFSVTSSSIHRTWLLVCYLSLLSLNLF